jgi:hypothetical protein
MISRARAESIRKAIAARFDADLCGTQPTLIPPAEGETEPWRIFWEEGPEDWPFDVDPVQWRRVFAEPLGATELAIFSD